MNRAMNRAAALLAACLMNHAMAQSVESTPAPAPVASTNIAGDGPTDPLVHEGILNAPVAEVWKVFSTAEGFKAFGVAQCEMDFRVGGLIRTHYNPSGVLGDDGTIVNRIIAFEPMRMVAFRIDAPPKGFPFGDAWKDTWSVATLTDLGDGRTLLRLAGMGYTADEQSQKMKEFFRMGNDYSVKILQKHFDASAAAPTGSAHAEDPLAPVEVVEIVDAPRQDVWKLIATSEGWKQFFGVQATIGAAPGEPFEVLFSMDAPEGQRGSEGCKVLSVVPGEMISWEWNAPPSLPDVRKQRNWVVVRLEEVAGDRTRVRLTNLGFREGAAAHPELAEQWKQTRAYFAQAWPKVVGVLKEHCAKK